MSPQHGGGLPHLLRDTSLTPKTLVRTIVLLGTLTCFTAPAFAAQCGIASWYGPGFHGKKAASGERFNQDALTAAHKSLPFGTSVKVTDQRTGKSIMVRINDRGPYIKGRIIDLSKAAATQLGIRVRGSSPVCIEQI